jgi:ABC-type transport system substrate-binding protein
LPYLNNDWQSKFYQGFLFDKCLDFEIDKDGRPEYEDSLCHVTTRDYKTYYANISTGNIRSDGVPFTIDDVYFTYNDIIKNNTLDIPYLKAYSDVDISMEENKIKIVFKNSSEDNTLFFTSYILPKHALINPNVDMYQQSFAIEPVYNNCAKIKSQSTDQYSLIFNLADCDDTNLGFYQIKNAISFDTFRE